MFKRLSIVTLTLSGLLLAGCANQQSADLKTSSDKTEQTTSNTPKKSTKSNQTTKSTKSTDETDSSEKADSSKESGSNQTQTQQDQTTSQTTTDQTQDQSDNQQTQDQTQQSVNLTTSQEAVEFLADKLSTTYDKSTTQYVANGKVTWNDVNGYQINIYSKDSDSPVGSYLVPANGQYFQIW
ncbi:hypothetical protein [Companilactobacillus farciminis]|uniref:hypothetical protein n=1 Tax=Companilactobacillus farciminis TaxID=1612 RepID=UPI0019152AFC|nr:hypothetical protein [Companilactobacillus farciminis]